MNPLYLRSLSQVLGMLAAGLLQVANTAIHRRSSV
jgi:hypothetical protein